MAVLSGPVVTVQLLKLISTFMESFDNLQQSSLPNPQLISYLLLCALCLQHLPISLDLLIYSLLHIPLVSFGELRKNLSYSLFFFLFNYIFKRMKLAQITQVDATTIKHVAPDFKPRNLHLYIHIFSTKSIMATSLQRLANRSQKIYQLNQIPQFSRSKFGDIRLVSGILQKHLCR